MSALVTAGLCLATAITAAAGTGLVHRRRLAQWRADGLAHYADTHRAHAVAVADTQQAREDLAAVERRHDERLAVVDLEVDRLARITRAVRPEGLERLFHYPVARHQATVPIDPASLAAALTEATTALPTLDGAR